MKADFNAKAKFHVTGKINMKAKFSAKSKILCYKQNLYHEMQKQNLMHRSR